jgi:hypothetical protein
VTGFSWSRGRVAKAPTTVVVVLVCFMLAAGCSGQRIKRAVAPWPPANGKRVTTVGRVISRQGREPVSSAGLRGSRAGTTGWHLEHPALAGQIEGFTSRVSGPAGQQVRLKVSTSSRSYRVVAFRVGAYDGGLAHRVWASEQLQGVLQPGPSFTDYWTRTVVAPWRTTLTVRTKDWRAGFYLFKLISADGWQALVPYVVRSQVVVGKVVLVAPVATWQAYNDWGGYSLYAAPPGDRRAWAVDFDRPYPAPGAGQMIFGVLPVAAAAEHAHVPLAYLTDLDLDANPGVLAGARAYVSLGHDEYWSRRMREAVEQARARGTNLVFLGANTMYWKVRAASSDWGPRRVLVGYKTDAALDPARQYDPKDATGLYRDDALEGPENMVTGMQYECFPVDAPYRVVASHWWGYRGTQVHTGTEFPHLVGVEADRVYPTATTPRPLQILSSVRYDCRGVGTSAQSSYYTTASGAAVFDVGTLRWTCALTGRCHPYHLATRTVRFVRHVTRTVLQTFAKGPAGVQHPAVDNLDQFDLPPVNEVPAS